MEVMAVAGAMVMSGALLLLHLLAFTCVACNGGSELPPISRRSFPKGFIFGTSSSSYQTKSLTEAMAMWLATATISTSMKEMGMDAYRFSISWSRILPNGSLSGGVNREGINYYNNLINELLSKGVQPFVTLFHWDSPQALEDKYKGFLSPNIINDYKEYAETCFKEFGDRVKHWITFNEPWTFCSMGYASGIMAPGRCSSWEVGKCRVGDSGREPYTACHHQLLAHAETVRLYKEKYQFTEGNVRQLQFIRDNNLNRRSAKFMDPLIRGDYPLSMRELVGNRLPEFSKEQSGMVKGAFDFIGLNYYTSSYADNDPPSHGHNNSYNTDSHAKITGICEMLLYVKENYGNPTIYITENGVDEVNNKTMPLEEALKDDTRIEYYHKHLLALLSAMRDGANVKGYFAWSLLDNFEWAEGYTVRFGINFVDYDDGMKRYPKNSARWFKKFLQKSNRDGNKRLKRVMAVAGAMVMSGGVLLLLLAFTCAAYNDAGELPAISRRSFPKGFIFGTSSSSYQFEGAAAKDKITDKSNGDDGSLSGGVNREGINYYNNLINELLSKEVQPFATLFHFDTPQALEDKYKGFLSPNIINDYKDYAEICFKEFGDRVKHWITFNEPWNFCSMGYASGTMAPGRCSSWEKGKCRVGDSGREPYTACHHQLLAHAETVRLYKEKYQFTEEAIRQSPFIRDNNLNQRSAKFMDPLIRGDYPLSMRELVGNRLPEFSKEQSEMVKGAFDFIGLNYYASSYADNDPPSYGHNNSYNTDSHAKITGVDEINNKTMRLKEALKDDIRIEYYHKHLLALLSAMRDGANVKGYFAWSLLDNFEWSEGYTVRFGINFVDYDNGMKRYPKNSARWFKKFLRK
uniref:Beta-glucosidase n=1 Tax=Oryza nivara TaxID=4536 RepID=A0A0E0H223_ORYNI